MSEVQAMEGRFQDLLKAVLEKYGPALGTLLLKVLLDVLTDGPPPPMFGAGEGECCPVEGCEEACTHLHEALCKQLCAVHEIMHALECCTKE